MVLLIDADASLEQFRDGFEANIGAEYNVDIVNNQDIPGDISGLTIPTNQEEKECYRNAMGHLEKLAVFLRPSSNQQMSRPMQRKLVTLINCQPLEEEGRARAIR